MTPAPWATLQNVPSLSSQPPVEPWKFIAMRDFGLSSLGTPSFGAGGAGADVHDALKSQGLGGLLAGPGGSEAPDAKKLEEEEKRKFEEVEKKRQAEESKEKAEADKRKVEDAKDAEAAKKKEEEARQKLLKEEDKGSSSSGARAPTGVGILGMDLVKDAKDKHPDASKKAGVLEGKSADAAKQDQEDEKKFQEAEKKMKE